MLIIKCVTLGVFLLVVLECAQVQSFSQNQKLDGRFRENLKPAKGKVKRSVDDIDFKIFFENVALEFYDLSKELTALREMIIQMRQETISAVNEIKLELSTHLSKCNDAITNAKEAQNESQSANLNAVNEVKHKLHISTVLAKLATMKEEIGNVRLEQNQISNTMVETLKILDLKVEAGFVNYSMTNIQETKKVDMVLQKLFKVDLALNLTLENDCKNLLWNGHIRNGVYPVRQDETTGTNIFNVYCDMEDDEGGWTVIQRRGVHLMPKAQRESFNRSWTDYENGFGHANNDHWIGLRNMHSLSNNECHNELKITLTAWNETKLFARYSNFQVSGKNDNYRLTIGNWTGGTLHRESEGMMEVNNGMKFSTFDKENDMKQDGNCAVVRKGAWWHKACTWVNLNGEYGEDGSNGTIKEWATGLYWNRYGGYYSFMKSEMKIRSLC